MAQEGSTRMRFGSSNYLPYPDFKLTIPLDGTPEALYTLKTVAVRVWERVPKLVRDDLPAEVKKEVERKIIAGVIQSFGGLVDQESQEFKLAVEMAIKLEFSRHYEAALQVASEDDHYSFHHKRLFEAEFRRIVDVVAISYKGEEIELFKNAASEILGFEAIPNAKDDYRIDSFHKSSLKSTLLGDIHIEAFGDIGEDDTWTRVQEALTAVVEESKEQPPLLLDSLKVDLKDSSIFKKSMRLTYDRYCETMLMPVPGKEFYPFFFNEIRYIVDRVRHFRASSQAAPRAKAVFGWLTSARDGKRGTESIILSHIARADLTAARENHFGGRLHAGGASVTQHHTLEEMRSVFEKDSLAYQLFTKKMGEEITPGLKYFEADLIATFMLTHGDTFEGIETIAALGNPSELIRKVEIFVEAWGDNIWARHSLPNGPHVLNKSIDRQASKREPLHGNSVLLYELEKLRQHLKVDKREGGEGSSNGEKRVRFEDEMFATL